MLDRHAERMVYSRSHFREMIINVRVAKMILALAGIPCLLGFAFICIYCFIRAVQCTNDAEAKQKEVYSPN